MVLELDDCYSTDDELTRFFVSEIGSRTSALRCIMRSTSDKTTLQYGDA